MHRSKRQGISMEHPLQVEEYLPGAEPPVRAEALDLEPPRPAAAEAAPAAPLPPPPDLPASDVLYLRPGDPEYAAYLPATNKRTQLSPSLRAVCKTERAASVMVDWVRANNLNFAVRCGGHSYEGFSQSTAVVIDVRGLSKIAVDKTAGSVTLGSGASLFSIYQALAAEGLAIPAGSCPTVGISGHLTGGGFGLLGRAYGLTCDHLRQVTLVDSQARPLQASATSNPDLFWACRGGGGGSFGVATEFVLSAIPLRSAVVFGVSWALPQSAAARVFQAWQSWAPNAPKEMTSIMKIGPAGNGRIAMRCIGQSIGSESEVRNQLRTLVQVEPPSKPLTVQTLAFLDAVRHFAGPLVFESVFMKAKSDYVVSALNSPGIGDMLSAVAAIPAGGIALLCDAYGGAVAEVDVAATAFPHRHGSQYCIQYYASWSNAAETPAHLAQVAGVYNAMRPYMVGSSYVNYCDLDLRNWASAYWGPNLDRLMAVKRQYDPANLFRHAQSVPPGPPIA